MSSERNAPPSARSMGVFARVTEPLKLAMGRMRGYTLQTEQALHRWNSREEDPVPMKLCSLCSALNIDRLWNLEGDWSHPMTHQPSFPALQKSADDGCEMCLMFLECVSLEYCYENGCSINQCHQVFRKVSRQGESPCLLSADKWANQIHRIDYAIADEYSAGNMTWINRYYTRAGFLLSSYLGNDESRIRRRELDISPNWKIARKWIDECTEKHSRCYSYTKDTESRTERDNQAAQETEMRELPQLPTRVIDVSPEGSSEPRLCISEGRRAEYVTLSHCWGTTKPLVTTSADLPNHLVSIPSSRLPRTFQDAIRVTQELGYKYLWIDSLCIVQDSLQDWERECKEMAQTYRNSAVTISGSAAANCSDGFLHPRPPPTPAPYLWEYEENTGTKKWATLRHASGSVEYPYYNNLTEAERNSPLKKRGWILQEHLLSPRLLFLGRYRMYWECNQTTKYEDFPDYDANVYGDDRGRDHTHCSITKFSMKRLDFTKTPEDWRLWYKIVEEYTTRKLTKADDVLPALSGIASWMFSGEHDRYVAGIIKQALHEGLAWWTSQTSGDRPPGYHGPSWTWISTNSPVSFSSYAELPMSDTDDYLKADSRRIRISNEAKKLKLDIESTDLEIQGLDPFGQVKFASIKLRGKLLPAKVTYFSNPNKFFHVEFSDDDRFFWNDFRPDNYASWCSLASEKWQSSAAILKRRKKRSNRPEETRIELGITVECLAVDLGYSEWVGLAVEPFSFGHPASSQDNSEGETYKRYRRIGFIHGKVRRSDEHFYNAPWERIELV
ncbi:uncharacterized protein Z519_12671 [Cladophialophora bantiana CBS 173.52]|uniref:Heterokaryon incompatibility domain-containing protein n=1 Tax=Cladophialophora bantiana (strain ATCC 10958 / CBS 173.52 / CDC B-1940 / NIH 8579) TaxID=1442370 RepID=A0A0D2H0F2_CLAB1|nr:uncharacterized protein Z519_12671 [Cladophialophora bantiana CBS 173.52]KIW86758.1 hypothetical protein Z519_12671 [Cladophialophora bantiana CBS 173.52]